MIRRSLRAIDSAGSAWVHQNRDLVDRAVLQFQATGQWPLIKEFQRQLDRRGLNSDVAAAARSMPSLAGGAHTSVDHELAIPLWLLRNVDSAQPLVQTALVIIRRAVELYLSLDHDPDLRSDDPAICRQAGWPELVLRAGNLIEASPPNPFLSGTREENGWNYTIDESFTSRLKNVRTLDDYIKCQMEWLRNSAEGPGSSPATVFDSPNSAAGGSRPESGWSKVIITGLFVLAAATLGAVIPACISNGGTATHATTRRHSASPSSVAGIPVDPRVQLSYANFCSWRFAMHPMPLASVSPVRVRIDDRCNFPKDPNPVTDSPTGVYGVAAQSLSAQVGSIRDGQLVTIRCYVLNGEAVSDAVGNLSRIWLGLVSPRGLIPDVNIGGGYSEAQLNKLGLPRCGD